MKKLGACVRAVILLFLAHGNLLAQEVKVDSYEPPKLAKAGKSYYPSTKNKRGEEGWVELQFMVDTDGKPFEITVAKSTDEAFKRAAMTAIEKTTFTPAKNNGEPVVGSHRIGFQFTLQGPTGASQVFVDAYKKFTNGLAEKTVDEAQADYARLKVVAIMNRYEVAFLNFAGYMLANRSEESDEKKMQLLDAALSYSHKKSDPVFLGPEAAKSARQELMKLQTLNKLYGEALETYQYFEEVEDDVAITALRPVAEQIKKFAASDQAYALPLTLDENGNYYLELIKHQINIHDVMGEVAEFKVRCRKKYVGFAVEPEVVYAIPAEWGSCRLEIIGDPGTTFSLVQQ